MVRRGQQKKRDQRREDALHQAALDAAQVHGDYVPLPREDCTPREFYLPVDDNHTLRIDARTWADARQVIDFSLMARQLQPIGKQWDWVDIARVDICHGHAHLHLLTERTDEVRHIMRIDSIDQVQEAYRLAVKVIGDVGRILMDKNGDSDA